jgi:ParB family chromosome partitioning protein
MGHARALLPLPATLQREAAQQICLRGLSVRETEELVRRLQQQPVKSAAAQSETQDPDIRLLQEDLSERLGAKVSIQHNTSGKGRLVIQYNSLDELDGILNHVK